VPVTKIGIIGTGFVSRGLVGLLQQLPAFEVTSILTRRNLRELSGFPRNELLTNSVEELIDKSEIAVECSGDVVHATEVIAQLLAAALPVVTMDAELQVTTGSYFVGQGFLTEAEGDQPGLLAAFDEEVRLMGFEPVVYGNIKGYLNHTPSAADMVYWAKKYDFTLTQAINFTDGTKLNVEQALVANGLSASLAREGMIGPQCDNLQDGALALAEIAAKTGLTLSDYILSKAAPPGVFIVAAHQEHQRRSLATYKLGDGPFYVLFKPIHLCYFEIPKTLKRVVQGGGVLLDNSPVPHVSVSAVAKQMLPPGTVISHGIGSFQVRGEAINISGYPDHVPIGLLQQAVVKERIDLGQRINFSDVELPDSQALQIWRQIRSRSLRAMGPAESCGKVAADKSHLQA